MITKLAITLPFGKLGKMAQTFYRTLTVSNFNFSIQHHAKINKLLNQDEETKGLNNTHGFLAVTNLKCLIYHLKLKKKKKSSLYENILLLLKKTFYLPSFNLLLLADENFGL